MKNGARGTFSDKLWLIFGITSLVAGAYILLLAFAPALPPLWIFGTQQVKVDLTQIKPGERGNRLYIPAINVDVAIGEGNDPSVLDSGAWHRQPQNGNPIDGGNFVLSAHRFAMGLTPAHTLAKSPFYNIDKLFTGDEIFVDYQRARYTYKVTKRYDVPRTAVEIEARSGAPKLTLYSCDLRGEQAGRIVLEAELQGL
jgi:LPXTG-site transpeptidase (sortase) family protein